jgi:hypothetical protein
MFFNTYTNWGVFDIDNIPIAVWDNFLGIEYIGASHVSDHQLEKGAFASYNKVGLPYAVRLRVSCGESNAKRTAFLAALEIARKSLDLYSVVTPDAVYQNANIEALDYRRTQDGGAGLIVAELTLREIRQTSTTKFPKNASAANPTNTGSVDPKPISYSTVNGITYVEMKK